MDLKKESELRAILGDPKKRRIARSGVRVLQIIKGLMEKNEEPNPRNITLEYYSSEINRLSDADVTSFIKKRRSVISRKLSDLQKIRLVMALEGSERTDGRSILYNLTLAGIKLLNDEDLYLSLMEDRSDPAIKPDNKENEVDMEYRRKYHSNSIRALLTKVKDEISRIFDRDFIPDNINPAIIRLKANNLSFKEDTLYDDLQNHIGTFLTFNNLETKLKNMKVSVNGYLDLEDKVRRIIISELSRGLGMVYSEHLDQEDIFGPNLVDWVVGNLYYLNSGENGLYKRYTSDLRSEKERVNIENEKAKQIRIDGAVVMVLSINRKESYYLGKISDMMSSMGDTPILEHYSEMIAEKMKAKDIQNEIIPSLNKEIEIPIYPGKCPYISME